MQNVPHNLSNLDDTTLIKHIKSGNEQYFEILTSKYLGLISSIASKYQNIFNDVAYDIDDLIQEGLLGLLSASKTYNNEKETSFKNYAVICIENRFTSIARKSKKQKQTISLTNDTIESIIDDNILSTQELFESREYVKRLREVMKKKLSNLEYDVIKLYLSGLSYKEIATKLSIEEKSVDNAIQRIHKKLSNQ